MHIQTAINMESVHGFPWRNIPADLHIQTAINMEYVHGFPWRNIPADLHIQTAINMESVHGFPWRNIPADLHIQTAINMESMFMGFLEEIFQQICILSTLRGAIYSFTKCNTITFFFFPLQTFYQGVAYSLCLQMLRQISLYWHIFIATSGNKGHSKPSAIGTSTSCFAPQLLWNGVN